MKIVITQKRKGEKNMNANSKKLLCSKCRKRVSYHVHKRPNKYVIKGFEVHYEEYYATCDECTEEIFVPDLQDANVERIDQTYREKNHLITKKDIEEIMSRYNIDKRPLSKLLGLGELTITRYLDGQLPSQKYSDMLYEILFDEQKLEGYIEKNQNSVSEVTVKKVREAIQVIRDEKTCKNTVERIALYIVNVRPGITNLMLQKLLYYIKGLGSAIEGCTIIPDACEAWRYGPVFPTVYEKYKRFADGEISSVLSQADLEDLLSDKEKDATNYVLETFGIYNVWFLKKLTNIEIPWREARGELDENDKSNNVIENQCMNEYFDCINMKYHLEKSEGVDRYIKDMKMEM